MPDPTTTTPDHDNTRVTIDRPNDEVIEIYLGNTLVASANHDDHGWSGMEAVERTALAVDRALQAQTRADVDEVHRHLTTAKDRATTAEDARQQLVDELASLTTGRNQYRAMENRVRLLLVTPNGDRDDTDTITVAQLRTAINGATLRKHPHKASPPPGGWPSGGQRTTQWMDCTDCGDTIFPEEHVYPAGDVGVRCAVCEVHIRRGQVDADNQAIAATNDQLREHLATCQADNTLLTGKVTALADELEQADNRTLATRQMANNASAALRQQLLTALDLDDDGHTSLTAFAALLVDERDQIRYDRQLLGVCRVFLDGIATSETAAPSLMATARKNAADLAQRIVDEIGHPVTDEPALGPTLRTQLAEAEQSIRAKQADIDHLRREVTAAAERAETAEVRLDLGHAWNRLTAERDRLLEANKTIIGENAGLRDRADRANASRQLAQDDLDAFARQVARQTNQIDDLGQQLAQAVDVAQDHIDIAKIAIRYVNCSEEEAATGEPYDELVHAVRIHERRPTTAAPGPESSTDGQDVDVDPDDVIEGLLANVRRSLASATTDDERAEAIEMLLGGWYAAWPDSAVTDPDWPIARELVAMLTPPSTPVLATAYADGYAAAVTALRDGDRYQCWWTDLPSTKDLYWQDAARGALAVYLEAVGPDGPEVEQPEPAAPEETAPYAGNRHAEGYATAVAVLRDDDRYRDWWQSAQHQPTGPVRQHLADYLETIGPDGPDVEAYRSRDERLADIVAQALRDAAEGHPVFSADRAGRIAVQALADRWAFGPGARCDTCGAQLPRATGGTDPVQCHTCWAADPGAEPTNTTETAARVLATALDQLGARIHRDIQPGSSYLDIASIASADPQFADTLAGFADYAEEQLAALNHPAVRALSAAPAPAEPTNTADSAEDAARRYAGEVLRLGRGLLDRNIQADPWAPVNTTAVDTALYALDKFLALVAVVAEWRGRYVEQGSPDWPLHGPVAQAVDELLQSWPGVDLSVLAVSIAGVHAESVEPARGVAVVPVQVVDALGLAPRIAAQDAAEHDWQPANDLVPWAHCGQCGTVRRHDSENGPCRGPAAVELRSDAGQ